MSDTPADNSFSELLRLWEKGFSIAWRTIQEIAEFVLLIVVVAGALLAISEIGTREAFTARVEKQFQEAQTAAATATTTYELKKQAKRIALSELNGLTETAPEYSEREAAMRQAKDDEEDARQATQFAIERASLLSAAQTALANATAMGIDGDSPSLRDEMKTLQTELKRIAKNEREMRTSAVILSTYDATAGAAPDTQGSTNRTAGTAATSPPAPTSAALIPLFFDRLRSEHLLAMAVVLSAVLGSLLAVVRQKNVATVRTVTLGAATGFIVYLAIKGGRYVFLMQMQGDAVTFNPYSSAFAGLVAGLFSDTAYGVLSVLVGDLANRIKRAFSPPGDDSSGGGPISPKKPPDDGPADELAQKRAQMGEQTAEAG